MLFQFLKYLQPTHYFQKYRNNDGSVFPKIEELSEEILKNLEVDYDFNSKLATNYDLSWQAINKGYIGDAETYHAFSEISLEDNYRFIRKYFNKAWVLYVLGLRLLSLNNPFHELKAFLKTKHVKRVIVNPKNIIKHEAYESFESQLIVQKLKVSVIIPTLNRYNYLNDVLKDLETQDYKNFEVIVVDQSEPFDEQFFDNFNLDIKLIRQKEKALWLARNTAIQNSTGRLIALSEDDVRIKSNWISSHLKCLDFFNASVSAGVFFPEGQVIPKERSFFAVASQFATGNAMLYKDVFKTVGLFDRQFEKQRMGDGEFGLRVFLKGMTSVSNPIASCIDVKASSGGLREMGSWDAFRPSNFFAPRPIPSVLYFYRRYFGRKASKLALIRTVPISIFPYQFKKNKLLNIVGAILTFLIMPLVIYQVLKSWQLSSKKIEEGPLINPLND